MIETFVEIDIDKIIKNIKAIRTLDETAMFCAVVKANGYGLGSTEIATEIEEYVDYFAVARLNEAIVLRRVGIRKPILILGYVSYEDVDTCIYYDIDIPIYDLDYARKINDHIKDRVNVHIAIDTGHSRIGFRDFEIEKIKKLRDLEHINCISAFTHYSTADEADTSFTELQTQRFFDVIDQIADDFDIDFLHISNTAGTIKHKKILDMARVGIGMYGLYPSDVIMAEREIDLDQSFVFKSVVSFVKEVDENTAISYGRTYITDKKMTIATIPIGYADGYPRALSNKGEVMIKGELCRVLGRVCMDQIMVDVTGLDVNIGDEVIVYPDIYKEANKIDSICYELMTAISIRVPRIYKKNGRIISIDDYLGEIYED